MRAGFRFLSLMILLLSAACIFPQMAFASDARTISKALAGQPFRDLPGVKLQQKTDDLPATVCTSYIGQDFWGDAYNRGGYRSGLGRRIYSCDVDNVTVESSKRPDEIDWKKQKRYYKPWIDDGFDRDR